MNGLGCRMRLFRAVQIQGFDRQSLIRTIRLGRLRSIVMAILRRGPARAER